MSILTIALAVTVLLLGTPALPAAASPPLNLRTLGILYLSGGGKIPTGYEPDNPTAGTWSVTYAHLGSDGRMTLAVAIRPPTVSLPVQAGPAVMLASVELNGGDGDVGVEGPVGSDVVVPVRACRRSAPCVLRATITLPTDQLRAAALPIQAAYWQVVTVGLTLVRTFANGAWIQVSRLSERPVSGGTVASPKRPHGTYPATGLVQPAQAGRWLRDRSYPRATRRLGAQQLAMVDRLRQAASDTSAPAVSVPATLDLRVDGCRSWTIHAADDDVALDVNQHQPAMPRHLALPAGTWWTVSVPGLYYGEEGQDLSFGPFFTAGGPIVLSGSLTCNGAPSGRVTATRDPAFVTQVWFCDWVDGGVALLRRGGPPCAA